MLEIIIVTFLISTFLNLLLKQFQIPTIIGYIATGTIITYAYGLHDLNSHALKEVAEFGVVFLMFTIGLEFSITHLIRMRREVFLYGGLQVFLTATLFTLVSMYAFDVDVKSSIIIGAALALSSTAIVLKILNENGDINKEYGRKVLGILLFQDIAVIPILLMITIFSATDKSVSELLLQTGLDAVILLSGLYFAGKYLLEPFLYHVSQTKSNEIFISSILLIVIGASYVAHWFSFSYSLGAFVAGMLIAETHYKHQVEADLVPFRDLLLGIFFITVGMQLNFDIISDNILIISLLLPLLIVSKVIIIFLLVRFEHSKRVSVKTALSLFQLGEFGLVVFELSFAQNLLDPVIGQILIVIVVISMILTPFLLRNISTVSDLFLKNCETPTDALNPDNLDLKEHVILIGYGRLGKNIAKLLEEKGLQYIVIEGDIKTVKDAQRMNKPVIFGNAAQKSILEAVRLQEASSVVISIGNNQKLHLICEAIADLNHNVKTIVKVNKYEEKDALEALNISHIIVETEKTALAMLDEALLEVKG